MITFSERQCILLNWTIYNVTGVFWTQVQYIVQQGSLVMTFIIGLAENRMNRQAVMQVSSLAGGSNRRGQAGDICGEAVDRKPGKCTVQAIHPARSRQKVSQGLAESQGSSEEVSGYTPLEQASRETGTFTLKSSWREDLTATGTGRQEPGMLRQISWSGTEGCVDFPGNR